MNDREMLELAAKAAGVHAHHWSEQHGVLMCSNVEGGDPDYGWNPLTDDGDALLLAVACDISIGIEKTIGRVEAYTNDISVSLYLEKDEMAVVRRAIVRAAAELGSRSNALLSRKAADSGRKND